MEKKRNALSTRGCNSVIKFRLRSAVRAIVIYRASTVREGGNEKLLFSVMNLILQNIFSRRMTAKCVTVPAKYFFRGSVDNRLHDLAFTVRKNLSRSFITISKYSTRCLDLHISTRNTGCGNECVYCEHN